MKILIISDTHGRNQNYLKVLSRVSPIDLLIHLGDFEGSEELIESAASCRHEFVSGNNDFFNGLPKDKVIQIGKYTVFLTHGHRYGVYYGTADIREAAARNNANIVMFGHTHVPMMNLSDDIWVINPGSLSLPRQTGRIPTYIIMEIDSAGDAHFTLNYLQDYE
jgi:putative phosphoesterase